MTRYEPAIDVDGLTAIDVHVHVEIDEHGHSSLPPQLAEAASAYFSTGGVRPDLDGIAAYYRERRMAAVVFTVDATTRLGHPAISSADIAAGAARHHDVLIPFGSVDPLGSAAIDDARRLVEDSGVRGFKFHPTVQGFDPSDERHYPLYGALEELGVVALFHTGQTGIGAGLPGGYGLRLGLSNPILLDPVAADFPDLQIVMAHPSVPWQEEALSVATHKRNTWIDLSGWSPKYFPDRARPLRQLGPEAPGALRFRLPDAHPRPVDRRCRADRAQARGDARDHARQRRAPARAHDVGACMENAFDRYGLAEHPSPAAYGVLHVTHREQFGRPLGGFQLVQEKLARMLGNVTASLAMVAQLSRRQDAGHFADEDSSLAKMWTALRARETVALAREVVGGNGIVLDEEVARFFADAEAVYSYEGTHEINALIVGRALTGCSAFV